MIAADRYIKANAGAAQALSKLSRQAPAHPVLLGTELVPSTRRMALMNCLLHGIEGDFEGAVHQGNNLGPAGRD